jgi:hypothetical protein
VILHLLDQVVDVVVCHAATVNPASDNSGLLQLGATGSQPRAT